jgi:peptide/nickel transport system permease protein
MFAHILHRLLLWVTSVLPVRLGVYALAFSGAGDLIKLIFLRAPGDVACNPEKIVAIRDHAGQNRPFLLQFGSCIWNLLLGNFGNSLTSGRSVWKMVSAAAPVALTLGLCAMVLTAVVAQLGLIMITVFNGSIFVELVFGLPGLGRLTVQALINSDFSVILAITLIGSFLVMASNLLVDLLYPRLDPPAAGTREAR